MSISDNLFWRRLHSFTGVIPLGGFLLFHIFENSYSYGGPEFYNEHIRPLRELPYLLLIETIFIYIPLAWHAFYGVYIWSTNKNNVLEYRYTRNWLYTLQRWTGIFTLFFVFFHVLDQRTRAVPSFESVASSLHVPYVLAFYILGVAFAAFHLGNGLWNALIKWGITSGARSQKITAIAFTAFWIVLGAAGIKALVNFL
ncbi:MAG: succinate dehydrogenase/fumarate reductase transmembrane subunit [Nitrospirota bacterium]